MVCLKVHTKYTPTTHMYNFVTQQHNVLCCTSFKKPSGNDGLKGLSINLEINVSFSEGLPSLLKNPPGIFPAA